MNLLYDNICLVAPKASRVYTLYWYNLIKAEFDKTRAGARSWNFFLELTRFVIVKGRAGIRTAEKNEGEEHC